MGLALYWNLQCRDFGLIIQDEYIDSNIIAAAILSSVGGVLNDTYLKLFDTSLEDVLYHLHIAINLHNTQNKKENGFNNLGLTKDDFEIDNV